MPACAGPTAALPAALIVKLSCTGDLCQAACTAKAYQHASAGFYLAHLWAQVQPPGKSSCIGKGSQVIKTTVSTCMRSTTLDVRKAILGLQHSRMLWWPLYTSELMIGGMLSLHKHDCKKLGCDDTRLWHCQGRVLADEDNLRLTGRVRTLEAQNRLLHETSQVPDVPA